MKTISWLTCLMAVLTLTVLPATTPDSTLRIVSGSALTDITGAQIPPQLFNEKCELIDTKAACDIANDVIGGCVFFGDECSYCSADAPGNTNESHMCISFDGAACAPKDNGPDNICGVEMIGVCIFDANFDLVCRSAPLAPCGDIKVTGC